MIKINRIHQGDCIKLIGDIPENSIDAIVTDPPYGLEFMGKEWDKLGATVETFNESQVNGKTDYHGKGNAPFAGSGSTGIAAFNEGFNYILIEIEKEYAEIARIRNAQVRL